MENRSRELLLEELESAFEALKDLEIGSKEYAEGITSCERLYKLKLEELKTDWEYDEKYNRREMEKENLEKELEMKESESKKQNFFRFIGYGIEAAGIVIPIIFYGTWMRRGFKFEETGTYTSSTFKGFFRNFKPTKV